MPIALILMRRRLWMYANMSSAKGVSVVYYVYNVLELDHNFSFYALTGPSPPGTNCKSNTMSEPRSLYWFAF